MPTASSSRSSSGAAAIACCPSSATVPCCLRRRSSPWGTGSVCLGERVSLEARLEANQGLRVQLGDTRLGHSQHLSDLAQTEFLVVVERHHQLLPLVQAGDGLCEAVLHLG